MPNSQLIVIFLRGAADALNLIAPHGEDAYYKMRPTLSISRPDQRSISTNQRAIDLDGFFGLHPALAPLIPAWEAGHLAIVHACGAPDESRSHFRSQELMERAVSDQSGPASGWIERYLAAIDSDNPSPLRAIGFGKMPQRSLRGGIPVTALRSIRDYQVDSDSPSKVLMRQALAALYTGEDPLSVIGRETLDMLEILQTLDPQTYQPAGGQSYPENEFGQGLRQTAMLIKANAGLEVAAIDLDGWDTHFAQNIPFTNLACTLGEGLGAFYTDLYARIDHLTVVVMTEFGRRVRENGSLGTDHGHGAFMMVLGGKIQGKRVYGDWPGLAAEQLVGPGDLAVTSDYRDVLAEILYKSAGMNNLDEIFPSFTPKFLGLAI